MPSKLNSNLGYKQQYHQRFRTSKVVSTFKTPKPTSTCPSHVKQKVCEVIVEALEREGVNTIFAASEDSVYEADIAHALMSSSSIRRVMAVHGQGSVFAAGGYARASGVAGVCITLGGSSASDFITGLTDAWGDSIPLVAISYQASGGEVPIADLAKVITKQSSLVLDPKEIPRIIREAFFLASSGRPGPVLIEIPPHVQQEQVVPLWNHPMRLSDNYFSKLEKHPEPSVVNQILRVISESKRPVLYVGGGCLDSSKELTQFVELTGIPVASTIMGLGVYPCLNDSEFYLQMLGMYGTVYANYAVETCDLLLAFGVRFDDRVTGRIDAFATGAKIVHIDIDSSEIGKIKKPHIPVHADIKLALESLNAAVEMSQLKLDFSSWRRELMEQKSKYSLRPQNNNNNLISPEYAIKVLDELTDGKAIISTGCGNHQMLTAKFYKFKGPRQLLTTGSIGAMGFGLPTAIGAAISRPGAVVVDIDGDGSFTMNIQELATVVAQNLPIKIMILNNQHLGMVVQGEGDDYYSKAEKGVPSNNYLGNPKKKSEVFPDMLKFAQGFGIAASRVMNKGDVKHAIQEMLNFPGPYLLDVIVPLQVHIRPMIPNGGTFKDLIHEGHGDEHISLDLQ